MTRRGQGEGSVFYDEKRGRWVGLVTLPTDGTGVRRRAKVTAATKTAARVELNKLRRDVEDGRPVGHRHMKVSTLLDSWLATGLPARSRVQSSNTVSNYRWAVDHARPALGAKTLETLSIEDVERLLVALASGTAATTSRPLSRSSVARVRQALVVALKWAQRRRWIDQNVADIAEMPTIATPTKDGRSLTVEQAKSLLEAAEGDRLAALVTVGLMLGLRPGELCGLRWADVDLDAGTLTVAQARKCEPDADGREVLVFGDPKTKKSRRTLDLPARAAADLRRHARAQAAERLKAGPRWVDLDLVFATSLGTPTSPSNLRRDIAALTERAGIGRWAPKELRHSAGSLLSAAGVPLEQIADLLGHTDTRMLERVYRHPVTSSVAAAAAPMHQMFGS